jgi:hypothetical protein
VEAKNIWIVRFRGEERDTFMTFDNEDSAFDLGVRFFIEENLLVLDDDPENQRFIENFLVSDIDLALETWNNSIPYPYCEITVISTTLNELTHNQTSP